MASSQDVFAAVKVKWDASSLSAYSGPYFGQKKKGVNMPYVTFISTSNVLATTTTHSEYWEHYFRFVIRARTAELAAAGLEAIGAAFDPATLSISNGTQVSLRRLNEGYFEEDESVFAAYIEYKVVRRKARPY